MRQDRNQQHDTPNAISQGVAVREYHCVALQFEYRVLILNTTNCLLLLLLLLALMLLLLLFSVVCFFYSPKICVPKRVTEEAKPVAVGAAQAAIAAVAAANLALAAANAAARSSTTTEPTESTATLTGEVHLNDVVKVQEVDAAVPASVPMDSSSC